MQMAGVFVFCVVFARHLLFPVAENAFAAGVKRHAVCDTDILAEDPEVEGGFAGGEHDAVVDAHLLGDGDRRTNGDAKVCDRHYAAGTFLGSESAGVFVLGTVLESAQLAGFSHAKPDILRTEQYDDR